MVLWEILAIVASIGWGIRPYFEKEVLKHIQPIEYLSLRSLLLILIAIIVLWRMKTFSKMKKFNRKTWIYLFVGLIMSTIGFFIFLNLIQRAMPSFIISILNPLTIIVTVLVGMWFFHQKVNVWMWVGIGLVIAGIVLIGIKGPKTEGTSAFGG